MSQELSEEIGAIEAIFPECVSTILTLRYEFRVPNHADVTLRLEFPPTYPAHLPHLTLVTTKDAFKYPDNAYMESHVRRILDELFCPEEVVLFEFLSLVESFVENYLDTHREEIAEREKQLSRVTEQKLKLLEQQKQRKEQHHQEVPELAPPSVLHHWIQSDPIVDRGSTFIAFARRVTSVAEAELYLSELVSDRKIARSHHNMNAYRIKGLNGTSYQDCDDDGETAAGSRMLHLLQVRVF